MASGVVQRWRVSGRPCKRATRLLIVPSVRGENEAFFKQNSELVHGRGSFNRPTPAQPGIPDRQIQQFHRRATRGETASHPDYRA